MKIKNLVETEAEYSIEEELVLVVQQENNARHVILEFIVLDLAQNGVA
jgi:hypothetical protein